MIIKILELDTRIIDEVFDANEDWDYIPKRVIGKVHDDLIEEYGDYDTDIYFENPNGELQLYSEYEMIYKRLVEKNYIKGENDFQRKFCRSRNFTFIKKFDIIIV